ncbi:MAG: hypothetical protein WCV64_12680 [Desulfurivibrionaceae bacterium]|jgi:hypothetical protein
MSDDTLNLCDYAVAFIDLLGQRAAMPERHLPTDQDEAIAMVKKSVGRIVGTQKLFEQFYNSYASGRTLHSKLPLPLQSVVPDMASGQLKWQYFSDGLVVYVPLGTGLVASPVNSLFGLLLASGMLCLVGMAAGSPIRAGVDAAWAVEYRPNELYGSAVAHAYKLESEIAQWPRVVVGEGLVGYLQHYATAGDNDISSQFRREMGSLCLKLLATDVDGNQIVDYLGQGYRKATKDTLDKFTVEKAMAYVEDQIAHWRLVDDKKLLERYEIVRSYLSRYASKI